MLSSEHWGILESVWMHLVDMCLFFVILQRNTFTDLHQNEEHEFPKRHLSLLCVTIIEDSGSHATPWTKWPCSLRDLTHLPTNKFWRSLNICRQQTKRRKAFRSQQVTLFYVPNNGIVVGEAKNQKLASWTPF